MQQQQVQQQQVQQQQQAQARPAHSESVPRVHCNCVTPGGSHPRTPTDIHFQAIINCRPRNRRRYGCSPSRFGYHQLPICSTSRYRSYQQQQHHRVQAQARPAHSESVPRVHCNCVTPGGSHPRTPTDIHFQAIINCRPRNRRRYGCSPSRFGYHQLPICSTSRYRSYQQQQQPWVQQPQV